MDSSRYRHVILCCTSNSVPGLRTTPRQWPSHSVPARHVMCSMFSVGALRSRQTDSCWEAASHITAPPPPGHKLHQVSLDQTGNSSERKWGNRPSLPRQKKPRRRSHERSLLLSRPSPSPAPKGSQPHPSDRSVLSRPGVVPACFWD